MGGVEFKVPSKRGLKVLVEGKVEVGRRKGGKSSGR